jgi:hypothetical protein
MAMSSRIAELGGKDSVEYQKRRNQPSTLGRSRDHCERVPHPRSAIGRIPQTFSQLWLALQAGGPRGELEETCWESKNREPTVRIRAVHGSSRAETLELCFCAALVGVAVCER